MREEKMFGVEEANGLMDVVRNYLLHIDGDLPAAERKGLGRLLDEIQMSLEGEEEAQVAGQWPRLVTPPDKP